MRRVLAAVAVAVALAGAAALPAGPASASGHRAMIARNHHRCTQGWDWDWHRSSHPEYVRVDLEPPHCTSPSYQVQAKGICATTGGGTYTTTSNYGRALEDEKYATCNHIHPLTDTLQYCYVRKGVIGGSWGPWMTVCVPIGTSPADGAGRLR